MTDKQQFGTGLKRTPKDERDFGLGEVYKQMDIADVPAGDWSFYDPLEVKDQRGTQECTGHGVASALEAHEGELINPSVQYAFIKEIAGDPTDTGANLRDAMKSGLKVGGVEKKDCDYGVDKYDGDFLADIRNYPEGLKDKAAVHKQRSFFSADQGRYNRFDNFITWLYQFRHEQPVIVTGVMWREGWTEAPGGVISRDLNLPEIGGHCIAILPKLRFINNEEYLGILNSYGRGVGDNGIFWFPRAVINELFTYDAFIYRDKNPEAIKQLRERANMSTWKKVWEWFVKSSADSSKTALTAKSALLGALPIVLLVTNSFGLEVSDDAARTFVDAISDAIVAVLGAVSAIGVAVGMLRKIYYLYKDFTKSA